MNSVINRAALRRHILETAAPKGKPAWKFTRVSEEFINQIEYWVESELRAYARSCDTLNPHCDQIEPKLLTWGLCRYKLLDLLQARVNWIDVRRVKDIALWHLEFRLKQRLVSLISSLPSVGKTIKP